MAERSVGSLGSETCVPLVPEQSPNVDKSVSSENLQPISVDTCSSPQHHSTARTINDNPQETVEIRIENIPWHFGQRYAGEKRPNSVILRVPSQTSISDMMATFDRKYPGEDISKAVWRILLT